MARACPLTGVKPNASVVCTDSVVLPPCSSRLSCEFPASWSGMPMGVVNDCKEG